MDRKFRLLVLLTIVVMVSMALVGPSITSAVPGTASLAQEAPPPPPPPPPDTPVPPPEPTKKPGGGGGGGGSSSGGGSRFLHCNSTIKGFVTDYGSMVPGSGVLVEVGASGWKNQTPADTNGYFSFQGLCKGTAYVKVIVPPGSLNTNPNAEVVLDGKNHVKVDLGFFPPVPQAASPAGTKPDSEPLVTSPPVSQTAPPASTGLSPPASLPQGVAVSVSAPRTVRVGMDAQVNISVQNGGPASAPNAVAHIPLAAGVVLKEAHTSRGSLRVEVVPLAVGKAGGVGAPLRSPGSELVVDVGALAPGDAVLIATKIGFKNTMVPGSKTEIQAEVLSGGDSYRSSVVVVTLEETGRPFQVTLPTTGSDNHSQYFQEFLW